MYGPIDTIIAFVVQSIMSNLLRKVKDITAETFLENVSSEKYFHSAVRFQLLTVLNVTFFWDMKSCSLVEV
jgi:hypothetical protein